MASIQFSDTNFLLKCAKKSAVSEVLKILFRQNGAYDYSITQLSKKTNKQTNKNKRTKSKTKNKQTNKQQQKKGMLKTQYVLY